MGKATVGYKGKLKQWVVGRGEKYKKDDDEKLTLDFSKVHLLPVSR